MYENGIVMIIFEAILYLTVIALIIYKTFTSKNAKDLFLFILFFILAFYLSSYENLNLLYVLSGYIIFNAIICAYGTKRMELFVLIGAYFLLIAYSSGLIIITSSIFLGGISSYNIYPSKKQGVKKTTFKKELRRNIFTMLGGLILLLLFLYSGVSEYLIIIFIFLSGITLLNNALIFRNGVVSKFLYGLERDNFRLGHGAIWLGIGTCFALSYLSTGLAFSAICMIFIADSISPIIGMRYGKLKLPYNKKKSVAGTASYFFAALILSYIFVGYYAILVAALGAAIESLPVYLDDNFDVPFVIFILSRLIPL